jgi:uncharacterized protein YndB with AHSA1/START domain
VEIAAPPQRVFQALVDPAQLQRWFHGGEDCPVKSWEFDPRRGGKYRYETQPSSSLVLNGVNEFKCHGEVLEYDPPRLLVYSWIANWHADARRATTVRWELTPTATGTRIKVTHSGLADEKVAREDYSKGWIGVVESLRDFVQTH